MSELTVQFGGFQQMSVIKRGVNSGFGQIHLLADRYTSNDYIHHKISIIYTKILIIYLNKYQLCFCKKVIHNVGPQSFI